MGWTRRTARQPSATSRWRCLTRKPSVSVQPSARRMLHVDFLQVEAALTRTSSPRCSTPAFARRQFSEAVIWPPAPCRGSPCVVKLLARTVACTTETLKATLSRIAEGPEMGGRSASINARHVTWGRSQHGSPSASSGKRYRYPGPAGERCPVPGRGRPEVPGRSTRPTLTEAQQRVPVRWFTRTLSQDDGGRHTIEDQRLVAASRPPVRAS